LPGKLRCGLRTVSEQIRHTKFGCRVQRLVDDQAIGHAQQLR
jgi:hypothetical protein